jgi:hypothetical protein
MQSFSSAVVYATPPYKSMDAGQTMRFFDFGPESSGGVKPRAGESGERHDDLNTAKKQRQGQK